ncbi:hypothetical protein FY034_07165 [Trichlorobacter lovleyi]|uniref:hypothetical protein n=1 Tax=Trichlorobacter lovleyi TaxID=313985 RepID=UPI002240CABF|nr:hypothetical protein [Trichlorobacter lovleyi]QOX78715.1 hypothetical protein FY034_07165 [Trichlorobacter lovleyi]
MKQSLTDWQQAVNSRVLVAQITALNVEANTATIQLNSGPLVADVPIHYLCNHNSDTHAVSRVFKTGDSVLVLYTGNAAYPSASNLRIFGLYGEIRRCLDNRGLVCDLNTGAIINRTGSAIMCGRLPVYSISKSAPTRHINLLQGSIGDSVSIAGQSDWYGLAEFALSWDWAGFRYGNGSPGNKIYLSGEVWEANTPGPVAGACIQGAYVVIATTYGTVHRRRVDKSDQWTGITGPVFSGGPWLFNASGTVAVHSTGAGYQLLELIALQEYSITDYPYAVNTYDADIVTHTTIATKEAILFADYQGDQLVTGTMHFSYNSTYTSTLLSTDYICGTMPESVPTYWIDSSTFERTTTQRMWLEFNGASIDLMSHDLYSTGSAETGTGSGGWGGTINGTVATSVNDYVAFLAGLDLRSGFYAVYKMASQRTINTYTTGSYTCAANVSYWPTIENSTTYTGGGSLTRSKILNGQELASRSCSLANMGYTLYPLDDYDPSFDNIRFFTNTPIGAEILTWAFLMFNIAEDSEITKPVIAEGMYGLSHAKNGLTNDELTAWLYDPESTPYVDYSGGDIALKLGIAAGFSAEEARVV